MMLALHQLSGGAQAAFYFLALVAFVAGAAVAYTANRWATFIAVGLALVTVVACWNALALS